MPEPLSISFTKQGLIDKAQQWVRDNSFGCSKDWHFTTLGCLVDFITDLYEPTITPNPPPKLESKQPRPAPQYDTDRLLPHFPEGEANALPCPQIQRRVTEDEGMGKATFYRIKEDLVARGLVKSTPDGLLFR